jgi:hypothetical protein
VGTAQQGGPAPHRKASTATAVAGQPLLTVRHFCQGLGDCHLLTFRKADGSNFYMLIDCGIHSSVKGGSATIDAVVADILTVTKTIDVLVITHEHIDHLSGFLSAADQFTQPGVTIGEVWMGWTENPGDAQARQLDKFKGQALATLSEAARRLAGVNGLNGYLADTRDGVEAVLGFNFGIKGQRVRSARDAAAALATKGIKYLEPSSGILSLEGVSGMRIYVLGPPRDPALLKITDRDSEMYGGGGAASSPQIAALQDAFGLGVDADGGPAGDCGTPFDPNIGFPLDEMLDGRGDGDEPALAGFLAAHYTSAAKPSGSASPGVRRKNPAADARVSDQSWRRIDHDWLAMSATLAMQLDDRTNNTSLVLAFESIDTGRVMLFAADAQIGSWLSWQDLKWPLDTAEVTGPDLLGRTVYYKVGHHGSENATAKAKGLQLMDSSDLSAFIPTNAVDAQNVGWGAMPFLPILDDLKVRTHGRTVRADDSWIAGDDLLAQLDPPSGSLLAVRHKKGLWVEFDLA